MANIKSRYRNKNTNDIYHFETEAKMVLDKNNNNLQDFMDSKGVANGLATLGADGKVPNGQLPVASTTKPGITRLDSTISSGETTAATPKVVKDVNDNLTSHTSATNGVHGSTPLLTNNSIIQRDSAGRAEVASPLTGSQIANKSYVDSTVTALSVNFATQAEAIAGAVNNVVMSPLSVKQSAGYGFTHRKNSNISGNVIQFDYLPTNLQTSDNQLIFFLDITSNYSFTANIVTISSGSTSYNYYMYGWGSSGQLLVPGLYLCSTWKDGSTNYMSFVAVSLAGLEPPDDYISTKDYVRAPKFYNWGTNAILTDHNIDITDPTITSIEENMAFSFRPDFSFVSDTGVITISINGGAPTNLLNASGQQTALAAGSFYTVRYKNGISEVCLDYDDAGMLGGQPAYNYLRHPRVVYSNSYWPENGNPLYIGLTDTQKISAALTLYPGEDVKFVGDFTLSNLTNGFRVAGGTTLDCSQAKFTVSWNSLTTRCLFYNDEANVDIPAAKIKNLYITESETIPTNFTGGNYPYSFYSAIKDKLQFINCRLNFTKNVSALVDPAYPYSAMSFGCSFKDCFMYLLVLNSGNYTGQYYMFNTCLVENTEINTTVYSPALSHSIFFNSQLKNTNVSINWALTSSNTINVFDHCVVDNTMIGPGQYSGGLLQTSGNTLNVYKDCKQVSNIDVSANLSSFVPAANTFLNVFAITDLSQDYLISNSRVSFTYAGNLVQFKPTIVNVNNPLIKTVVDGCYINFRTSASTNPNGTIIYGLMNVSDVIDSSINVMNASGMAYAVPYYIVGIMANAITCYISRSRFLQDDGVTGSWSCGFEVPNSSGDIGCTVVDSYGVNSSTGTGVSLSVYFSPNGYPYSSRVYCSGGSSTEYLPVRMSDTSAGSSSQILYAQYYA